MRLGVLAVALFAGPVLAQGGIEVGYGEVDVTPDIKAKPVYLAGFGKNRRATEVHDPIVARAMVLSDGKDKIALVSVDLVGFFHPSVEAVRAKLKGFAYVLVSSTHNHHGPDTIGMWGPNFFKTGVDPDYIRQVEAGIVSAVERADRDRFGSCATRYGTVRDADLLHDSRKPIVKHDELVTLRFLGPGGNSIGLIVQWNCHPEALNSKNTILSADYVRTTVDYLRKKHRCPVLYLTGTVGGLMTPIRIDKDDAGAAVRDGTFEATAQYGRLVGRLADKAIAGDVPIRLAPFEIRRREIYLPIDNPAYVLGHKLGVLQREAFSWSGDVSKAAPRDPNGSSQKLCCKTEIGYLRLGELDVACIPGEIYPELVLGKIETPAAAGADFPDAPTEPSIYEPLRPKRMIVGLANDEIGYVIPKRQWDEKAPFCYGRTQSQYGEINSLGPETAPLLCDAFRKLATGK